MRIRVILFTLIQSLFINFLPKISDTRPFTVRPDPTGKSSSGHSPATTRTQTEAPRPRRLPSAVHQPRKSPEIWIKEAKILGNNPPIAGANSGHLLAQNQLGFVPLLSSNSLVVVVLHDSTGARRIQAWNFRVHRPFELNSRRSTPIPTLR